jgi:phytoene dehydrogenase-like protein
MTHPRLDPRQRFDLYQIDQDTLHNATAFWQQIVRDFDEIVERFYEHILSHPEIRAFYTDEEMVLRLKKAQKRHWHRLFNSGFSQDYVDGVIKTAERHVEARVPAYYYIAAYNFFLNQLIDAAYRRFFDRPNDLPMVLKCVVKMVMVDIDLTLSVYTLGLLDDSPAGKAAPRTLDWNGSFKLS